jgi:hypothetical protein
VLSIDSSHQLQDLKSIDNRVTGLRLNLEAIVEFFHHEFVDLIQKNVATKKGSFQFFLLLVSLTFKTNVNILNLHHDILLNFGKVVKLLGALLSSNTLDIP